MPNAKTMPTMIMFSAPWCAPCKAAYPIVERVKLERAGRLGVEIVDISKDQQAAAAHQITSVPTFIVVDGEWNTVARHAGPVSYHKLNALVRIALGD